MFEITEIVEQTKLLEGDQLHFAYTFLTYKVIKSFLFFVAIMTAIIFANTRIKQRRIDGKLP